MAIASLDDWLGAAPQLTGRRVLVRADLNVPLRGGAVADDTRIRASLPTLRRLLGAGARVIVCSHLGRPKGTPDPAFSLRPVRDRLEALLEQPVAFVDDCVGEAAARAAAALEDGELLLLENLRFHPGETQNDLAFAKALAQLADRYVNDAFGTAHRAHASTAGVPAQLGDVAAGDLLRSELAHLETVLHPTAPFLCLLGGAKVSDKLGVLEAMIGRAQVVAVGGAMAYTFLRALGKPTGRSLVEEDRVDDARRILRAADQSGHALLLPEDHVVVAEIDAAAERQVVRDIPAERLAVDIGPETTQRYGEEAGKARTIFWNGPMGIFELEPFAAGTVAVARAVAASAAHSVVGGGDSLAAVNRAGVADRIDHLSTGGGASLEYIEGRTLPGVAALER